MVSTSALRETIVLVIFGIVLVPIAAKRAQDAPGYWKAFAASEQQSLVHHDRQLPTSALMLTTTCDASVSSSLPTGPHTVRNGTVSLNSANMESRSQSQGPLTIRFRKSKSEAAAHTTMTEAGAHAHATKVPARAVPTEVDVAVVPTATTTSAASRERWTLIWMGTAIAAVALFMSFC